LLNTDLIFCNFPKVCKKMHCFSIEGTHATLASRVTIPILIIVYLTYIKSGCWGPKMFGKKELQEPNESSQNPYYTIHLAS